MKLADLSVASFVDTLASNAPAPGGGSCAALEGALGVALTAMVASLTQGRKKFEAYAPFAAEAEAKANALKAALVDVIDRDTEAFNAVSAAFALPKDTDEQKSVRSAAIQQALKGCTETPMEMLRLMDKSIALTAELMSRGYNDSAASDLGVAFASLKTGLQGAWLNVLINIGSIKDEQFVAACRTEGEKILARAIPAADEGLAKVFALLDA